MSDDQIGAWLRGGDDVPDPPHSELEGASRRSRRLWLIALAPWALVVVLGAAVVVRSPSAPPDDAAPQDAGEVPAESAAPVPPPEAFTDPPEPADGLDEVWEAPADAVDHHILAAATIAVRDAVTGPTGVDEPARRYADHVAVDGVTTLDDLTIVTVSAVVLEGDERRWSDSRSARYGLALRRDGATVSVFGGPWPLPVRAAPAAAEDWTSVDADEAAVERALAAAGYGEVDLEVVERSERSAVLRVRLRGLAPGEAAAAAHEVWLDPDGPTVLGEDPGGAPPTTPDDREEQQP